MAGDKYEWILGSTPPPLEEHSRAKHDVFRGYLHRYIEVLTANPSHDALNLTLVDGFAGGGLYTDGTGFAPGSPIIMLNKIADMQADFDRTRKKPFRIKADFIFIEKLKPSVEFLRHQISNSIHARNLDQNILILNSTFEQEIPKIIDRIKARGRAHRCIFFLDQYGYNTVSFRSVKRILKELEQPEVILTFNVDFLIDYLSTEDAFLKGITPTGLDRSDVLRMLQIKDEQRGWRWFIQHFLYSRIVELTGAKYYTCFYVKSPESHRSYWLLHLSKHPRARDEMGLRHWEFHNHFVHHGRAGLRMLGYDSARDINQGELDLEFRFDEEADGLSRTALLDELPPLIHAAHQKAGTSISVGDLYASICNETPATFRQMSDVLVTLRNERETELLNAEGRPMPRATTLDWKDRVTRPLQQTMYDLFRNKP